MLKSPNYMAEVSNLIFHNHIEYNMFAIEIHISVQQM